MLLGIRTDSPVAEFYLFEKETEVARHAWQADRTLAKGLLGQLETFLADNGTEFAQLKGLFVYLGPGSFTGLRIGMTVMNTMAYGLAIPIVGTEGANWAQEAAGRLVRGENDEIVLPHYGAEARITLPKK